MDSESSIKRLAGGPGVQTDCLADSVWLNLNSLAKRWEITIQWILDHKDIEGNVAADRAAKEATTLR